MLVNIANRAYTDQTASEADLGMPCLSWPFGWHLVFESLEHLQL